MRKVYTRPADDGSDFTGLALEAQRIRTFKVVFYPIKKEAEVAFLQ